MSILPSVTSSTSWSEDGITKEKGTDESLSFAEGQDVGLITCEGVGGAQGALTLFCGGEAQAFP